uniref:Uncharacterized protein AlNc14C153G7562 n=1 Tax=Albugo laibachii Nc14 TaxID=890382 RepID=F0WM59_9STRA|nr:conserved hypothetical protein [Albugo laibachii Nc14]|eukprot:CCA22387.1 conserved hypothetical protein [Albugo laibachii Nc14]
MAQNGAVWDAKTQTYHGGQDWKYLKNFVEDFSVTTNALGTPIDALKAAKDAVDTIHHYPPADCEPAHTHLAQFLWNKEYEMHSNSLILGNGASELIDLVIRSVREGGWRPADTKTQYKEYERSCLADGRETLSWNDPNAVLTCIVNPTNPTGDYRTLNEMEEYILSTCKGPHTFIVDESMQPWIGPNWRKDSLIGHRQWVREMSEKHQIDIWVMTSWTKIWACTGIRLGSVIAPTSADSALIKKKQVPWSVNSMALAFLSAVVKDEEYMKRTWDVTSEWRAYAVECIEKRFTWKCLGKPFLSWIWIDTMSEPMAEDAVRLAKESGVPVRSGSPGYNLPTYIRIAVRSPEKTNILLQAWKSLQT